MHVHAGNARSICSEKAASHATSFVTTAAAVWPTKHIVGDIGWLLGFVSVSFLDVLDQLIRY